MWRQRSRRKSPPAASALHKESPHIRTDYLSADMRATTNHNREVDADIVSASRQKIKENCAKMTSTKKFLEIIGAADELNGVAGNLGDTLRVLMSGDICLIDTKTTDYNGRVCLVWYPGEKTEHYNRVFIDGDTVTVVCATDGDVYFTGTLGEVKIRGVVVGIVRKLEPEERKAGSAWDEFRKKAPLDRLAGYYEPTEKDYNAVRQHERGGAYGMFINGYFYGFAQGRKAQKAEGRRKRRAEKRKEAAQHD